MFLHSLEFHLEEKKKAWKEQRTLISPSVERQCEQCCSEGRVTVPGNGVGTAPECPLLAPLQQEQRAAAELGKCFIWAQSEPTSLSSTP